MPSDKSQFVKSRRGLSGVSADKMLKAFFGGNAFAAVIILLLITVFLFKEGIGFFGQYRESLELYRRSGLEYVDYIRGQADDFAALSRYLNDIQQRQTKALYAQGKTYEEVSAAMAEFTAFTNHYTSAIDDFRSFAAELSETAMDIKERCQVYRDRSEYKQNLTAADRSEEAETVWVQPVDLAEEVKAITGSFPRYQQINKELAEKMRGSLEHMPMLPGEDLQKRLKRFSQLSRQYAAGLSDIESKLQSWDPQKPVPLRRAFTSFIFGKDWITNSFFQDWYGIAPLFVGSLLVACVAMFFAVPFGVGAAIYVNQIAAPSEQKIIKPYIEFLAAIPSVVIGFFGIAIFGQFVRWLSQRELLAWVSFFPISERLNAFTAGCLLALLAIPTIFSLAEDALNNVPQAYKEASLSLGATRLQTIIRIIVPTALSGIISAVLLGFGRVIGETMVVLLCAGNRIDIPDFTQGLGAFFQPVHTMTGIIAQEMGEVVRDSIHYRALFLVGAVLFLITLLINYAAQKIVRRCQITGA